MVKTAMVKTAIAASAGGIAGALLVLWVRTGTDPAAPLRQDERAAIDSPEIAQLADRIDRIERSLELARATPEPARVEVDRTAIADVAALTIRVDALEKRLAELLARIDAMAQAGNERLAPPTPPPWPTNDALRKRLAATDANDADALVDLADWAADQGLATDAKRILRLAVKTDPDNARAREGLGYAKYDGRWMTVREIERARAGGH